LNPDITLIFPSSPFLLDQAVFPPLGILYLSAFLKQHKVNVQCLDLGLGHTPDMAKADMIGISVTTPQREEAFELAKRFKAEGRHVIAGGPHATHMPEECKHAGFDMAVQGRGELPLVEYFVPYLFEVQNIDDYPFPDRDALPIHKYHYKIDGIPATPIMTSRSCPFHCSFCAKIDNDFAMQSAERTVSEIRYVYEKYGFKAFMIFDDVFIASKKRLKRIVDMIGGQFKFRCFARSNLLDDRTCNLLSQLGVVEVGIGIESGSTEVLQHNMKGTTRGMNTNAVKRLHAHGIRAKAFLIVGLPGERVETIMDTVDWIHEAEPDDIDVSVFQPMPGSRIFADPKRWGIQFEYNGKAGWYKGTPGDYEPLASTEHLTGHEILEWRDLLEMEFKPQELLR
jgi:anaerobic magnesium-protoporphyrin IX monomethyl ester cyclase